MAQEIGVQVSVCEMTMDLMGMTREDLIDYLGLQLCWRRDLPRDCTRRAPPDGLVVRAAHEESTPSLLLRFRCECTLLRPELFKNECMAHVLFTRHLILLSMH